MLLQLQTWTEVEAYLERRDDIVVPIGSVEQHGPTGVLGVDAICAEILARGLGEQTAALVAPSIAVGMAQHHLGFPGSMSLRPTTLIAVIRDVVESLASSGFRRFLFINGHGSNVSILKAAFAEIYAERSFRRGAAYQGVACSHRNWWALPSVRRLAADLYGDGEGTHAMPSEVALSQFACPAAVRDAVPSPPAPRKRDYTDADDYRRKFPDGRVGSNPALARPMHGQLFYEAALHDLAREYRAWLSAR